MSLLNNVKTIAQWFILCAAVSLVGCRHTASAPIDWRTEATQWAVPSPNKTELVWSNAVSCMLILNPELNKKRIQASRSQKAIRAFGWWDDPELELDFGKFITGERTVEWGAGMIFSLPLTGIPKLEKAAAIAYADSDRIALAFEEREAIRELAKKWIRLENAKERTSWRQNELDSLRPILAKIQELATIGECTPQEYAQAKAVYLALESALAEEKAATTRRSMELLVQMGLPPDRNLSVTGNVPLVPPRTDKINPLAFTNHPLVQVCLSTYKGRETELIAAIRKQIPTLSLGPNIGREGEGTKLGVGVGISLPLWNRNQKEITNATAERDLARIETLNQWRTLVTAFHQANVEQEVAQQSLNRLEQQKAEQKQLFLQAKQLTESGELSYPDLLDAHTAFYDRGFSVIDAKQTLDLANITLTSYTHEVSHE